MSVDKSSDLIKFRDLVLSTLDFHLSTDIANVKSETFNARDHFENLKIETVQHYQKGRLTKLKQWFRDLSEPCEDNIEFGKFIKERTGLDIDLSRRLQSVVAKVMRKGKIATENQYRDVEQAVDQLCHQEPVDSERIDLLNGLLRGFEDRIKKRK